MREQARVKGDFKMKNGEEPDNQGDIIIYTPDCRKSQVSPMSRDERIWLNQKQMAELLR